MKAVKKALKWIVIVLIVLVVLAILVFRFAGDTIMKHAIQVGGTTALSVPVTVGSVNLSVIEAKFTITDVKVGNPQGYKAENMFELNSLVVDSNYSQLMADPAVIEEIVIDGINITMEQKGLTNNVQEILDGINKKSANEPSQPVPTDSTKPAKKMVIKKLIIKNAAVSAQLPLKAEPIQFTLATIELNDLGNEKPIDAAALSAEIMSAIAGGIAQAGLGILPDDMTGAMKGALGQADKLLESGKAAGEGLKDAGKSITEGIGGLFKPKEEQK